MSQPAAIPAEDPWFVVARRIDRFRVVAKLLITAYFIFFMKAWLEVFRWFSTFNWQSLPTDQVVGSVSAAAVAAFPTVILTILTNVLYKLSEGYWSASARLAKEQA